MPRRSRLAVGRRRPAAAACSVRLPSWLVEPLRRRRPPAPSGSGRRQPYTRCGPSLLPHTIGGARAGWGGRSGCLSTRWPSCGASRAVADRDREAAARSAGRLSLPWPADPGNRDHAYVRGPFPRRSWSAGGAWRSRLEFLGPERGGCVPGGRPRTVPGRSRCPLPLTSALGSAALTSGQPVAPRSLFQWGGRRRDFGPGHHPAVGHQGADPRTECRPGAGDGGAVRVGHSKQGPRGPVVCHVLYV